MNAMQAYTLTFLMHPNAATACAGRRMARGHAADGCIKKACHKGRQSPAAPIRNAGGGVGVFGHLGVLRVSSQRDAELVELPRQLLAGHVRHHPVINAARQWVWPLIDRRPADTQGLRGGSDGTAE